MSDERLVAVKEWIADLLSGNGFGSDYSSDELDTWAAELVAVFEKAHTPTGDEREALVNTINSALFNWDGEGDSAVFVGDAILAAGFRRSDAPEPSAEHAYRGNRSQDTCWVMVNSEMCRKPIEEHTKPQGEPSDAIPDDDQIAADNADWHTEYTEPRPEPSDAEVLAALNAYYGGKPPVSDAFKDSMSMNMRAALRAAGGAR